MKMAQYIEGQNIIEIEYYNEILFNLINEIGVSFGVDLHIEDMPYGLQLSKSSEFTLENGILKYDTINEETQESTTHTYDLNEIDALI